MYWRSEAKKTGMNVPARVQIMQANMMYNVTVPVEKIVLAKELFRKNKSKIDIAKEMAISK